MFLLHLSPHVLQLFHLFLSRPLQLGLPVSLQLSQLSLRIVQLSLQLAGVFSTTWWHTAGLLDLQLRDGAVKLVLTRLEVRLGLTQLVL